MEQIISAGGKGVRVENNDSALALSRMKDIAVFEKYLGDKIPGTQFEAGKINCTKKEKNRLIKEIKAIRGWVRFLQIGEEEIILTPSLKAVDDIVKVEKLTQEDMERYARQINVNC